MTPTVDADLGLVYIGTGNAVPMWGGELRPGDNLFSVSVVALDLYTGEYKWHQQLVHHDLWEHDLGTPLILYDATVDGETRKAVAAMRTDGYLFLLDAETGEAIFPIEERAVKQDAFLKTSPTQPFPVGADRIGPDCTPTNLIPPGFEADCYFDPVGPERPNALQFTSMRFAPMAYSPLTGYFYGTSCVYPKWRQRPASPWFWTKTSRQLAGVKHYGFHVALDSRTNRIVWQHRVPYSDCMGSGAMTTAGGLMFHAEPDGSLGAYDQTTGDRLWHFQTGVIGVPNPRGFGGGPVVTYELDGEQYVALTMNRLVWAFKLGGTVRASRPAPDPPPTEPLGNIEAPLDQGPEERGQHLLVQAQEPFVPRHRDAQRDDHRRLGERLAVQHQGHNVLPGEVPLLEFAEFRRAGLNERTGHRRTGRSPRESPRRPPRSCGTRSHTARAAATGH